MDMMISARILTILAGFFFGVAFYYLVDLYRTKPNNYKKQSIGLWSTIVLSVLAVFILWSNVG